MDSLSRHYHQLVRLNQNWVIADVQLDLTSKTLTLPLDFVGERVMCPNAGRRARSTIMRLSGAGDIWTRCSFRRF